MIDFYSRKIVGWSMSKNIDSQLVCDALMMSLWRRKFPQDVIVPAGITNEKMPVTISFFGPAYSEPRLLGYAYAYEQATQRRVSPATTPALVGEKFEY